MDGENCVRGILWFVFCTKNYWVIKSGTHVARVRQLRNAGDVWFDKAEENRLGVDVSIPLNYKLKSGRKCVNCLHFDQYINHWPAVVSSAVNPQFPFVVKMSCRGLYEQQLPGIS